jgi:hypothetical protein
MASIVDSGLAATLYVTLITPGTPPILFQPLDSAWGWACLFCGIFLFRKLQL